MGRLSLVEPFNKDSLREPYQEEEPFTLSPQIRRDYPLNLSILISGGKETNKDSLSNGE